MTICWKPFVVCREEWGNKIAAWRQAGSDVDFIRQGNCYGLTKVSYRVSVNRIYRDTHYFVKLICNTASLEQSQGFILFLVNVVLLENPNRKFLFILSVYYKKIKNKKNFKNEEQNFHQIGMMSWLAIWWFVTVHLPINSLISKNLLITVQLFGIFPKNLPLL